MRWQHSKTDPLICSETHWSALSRVKLPPPSPSEILVHKHHIRQHLSCLLHFITFLFLHSVLLLLVCHISSCLPSLHHVISYAGLFFLVFLSFFEIPSFCGSETLIQHIGLLLLTNIQSFLNPEVFLFRLLKWDLRYIYCSGHLDICTFCVKMSLSCLRKIFFFRSARADSRAYSFLTISEYL